MRWGLSEARSPLASQKAELSLRHYVHSFDIGEASALSHIDLRICTESFSNTLSS